MPLKKLIGRMVKISDVLPGESIWVQITGVSNRQYIGELRNTPVNASYEWGDEIKFYGKRIIDIEPLNTTEADRLAKINRINKRLN